MNDLLMWRVVGIVFSIGVPILVGIFLKITSIEVKDARLQRAIDLARSVVADVVAETTQTFVTELKDKDSFNEAARVEAFQKSKKRAMDILDDRTKKELDKNFNDLNKYVETLIESEVHRQKEAVLVTGLVGKEKERLRMLFFYWKKNYT